MIKHEPNKGELKGQQAVLGQVSQTNPKDGHSKMRLCWCSGVQGKSVRIIIARLLENIIEGFKSSNHFEGYNYTVTVFVSYFMLTISTSKMVSMAGSI